MVPNVATQLSIGLLIKVAIAHPGVTPPSATFPKVIKADHAVKASTIVSGFVIRENGCWCRFMLSFPVLARTQNDQPANAGQRMKTSLARVHRRERSVGKIGTNAEYPNLFNTLKELCGGEGGTRTPDPAIMSRVL